MTLATINQNLKAIYLVIFCIIFYVISVSESNADILESNNQISVSVASRTFDYMETVNDRPFDSETGRVVGLSFTASLMLDLIVEDDYLYLDVTHTAGNVNYVGSYWYGQYGSLRDVSSYAVNDISLRYGNQVYSDNVISFIPYGEFGHHSWHRGVAINSRGSLNEDYSHAYYGIGLLTQYAISDTLVVSGNVLIGATFNSQISAYLPNYTYSAELGNSGLNRYGVGLVYKITDDKFINISYDTTSYQYGKSEAKHGIYEPDSKTTESTMRISIGFAIK